MKNSLLIIFIISAIQIGSYGQKTYGTLYHPDHDAKAEVQKAIDLANQNGKHVLVQVGGNWCGWCYRLQDFIEKDSVLRDLRANNFVTYHLNYSKENYNKEILASFDFPQRFGFPALLVLDAKGNRLHTQDSALLESGDSYDAKKVKNFLEMWTPKALSPELYKK